MQPNQLILNGSKLMDVISTRIDNWANEAKELESFIFVKLLWIVGYCVDETSIKSSILSTNEGMKELSLKWMNECTKLQGF